MRFPCRALFFLGLVIVGGALRHSTTVFAREEIANPISQNRSHIPILPPAPNTISAGLYHSCGIRMGTVRCWGDNRDGQVGDGTATERHISTPVTGLTGIAIAVSSGAYHSCALTSSGVSCWGHNTYGQLGDGSNSHRFFPVSVIGLPADIIAIAAGGFHSCALTSTGGVKCWGANFAGQLGNATTVDQSTPTEVNKLGNTIAISAGYAHTCALTKPGAIKCWGANSYGQLGDGTSGNYQTEPVSVIGLNDKAIAIAAGGVFTCAVLSGGNIKCWGDNSFGELGDATNTSRPLPTDVIGLNGVANVIATGTTFACAITRGAVKCWGDNSSGQLGDGTTTNRNAPVNVLNLNGVTDIAAGDGHTCAQAGTGLECWGRDTFGELGDNAFVVRATPVNVIGLVDASTIGAGGHHTCAVISGGVKCWGINWQGQVGDGTTWDRLAPVAVSGLSNDILSIAIGYAHNCALTTAGATKCWGHNASGQLGDGTVNDKLVPVDVIGLSRGITAISSGYSHTCAVTESGGAKCWGDNSYGQLGDGTFGSANFHTTPVDVIGLSNVVGIAIGNSFSCALVQSGAVKCWGWNFYGQLGDGSTIDHILPAEVAGLSSNVVKITAGWYHMCAIMTNGGLKCWGLNSAGQLGDGTVNNRLAPVDVHGLATGVSQASAGWLHTCAITSSGDARCWGWNINGALGDGTRTNRSTPVDVIGLSSGTNSISAGQNYSCALIGNGSGKCWGFNYYGQLGNGQAGHRTTPVSVVWLQYYYLPLISK